MSLGNVREASATMSVKKCVTAFAAATLVAVAVSACGENGSRTTDQPSETVDPPPETVSNLIHMATGADQIGNGQPPIPFASAAAVSHFASIKQTISGPRVRLRSSVAR